jgi:hypothetical protein
MCEATRVNVSEYMANLLKGSGNASDSSNTSQATTATCSTVAVNKPANVQLGAITSANRQFKAPEIQRGMPKRAQNVFKVSGYIRIIEDLNKKAKQNDKLMDMYEKELNSCQEETLELRQELVIFSCFAILLEFKLKLASRRTAGAPSSGASTTRGSSRSSCAASTWRCRLRARARSAWRPSGTRPPS